MNKKNNIFAFALSLVMILCSCSNNMESGKSADVSNGGNSISSSQSQDTLKGQLSDPYEKMESGNPTDVSNEGNSIPSSQNQGALKGRLSNPYEKDEIMVINTEDRSWYNIVRDTTSTYGAAQLKLSIVEDMFSMSGTVTNDEGEKEDYCVMLGVCIEAVSIPDEVDYICFSDYIPRFNFLTSDKSEVDPNAYWSASYDGYIDMYNEAKNNGHINYDYYINIDYREQNLYEGGKIYFLLGGLCSTDFGVSSPDELEFLAITSYDKDSKPVTAYMSMH